MITFDVPSSAALEEGVAIAGLHLGILRYEIASAQTDCE
jgi:hypothetical protein